MSLYAVKTTASQERSVADMVATRGQDSVEAVLSPDEMVSYVMVETDDLQSLKLILEDIPHSRGVIEERGASMSEIEHFLEPTSDVENVHEGDVVEVTEGPFAGEKATVQRFDEGSDQVTVEMNEAAVPIPVTIRGDQLRVLDSDER